MSRLEGKPLNYSYDAESDVLLIERIRYSGSLFRSFGIAPAGTVIQIIDRQDGMVTCKNLDDYDQLKARVERYEAALKKISAVTQFDHPTSQIIGSEEYEGAWLDCTRIAAEILEERA